MSWFFETKIRESRMNGTIIAKRHWGAWRVFVEGTEQTGPKARALWQGACAKIKNYQGSEPIRKVLMLGLGGGGEIQTLYKYFPNIQLSIIEYDQEMIALAQELALAHPFPNVICADAAVALPRLEGTYDLIIIDLFRGQEPSPLATDPSFLKALDATLDTNGFLITNVFAKAEYLESFKEKFTVLTTWKFGLSHIGIFQKKFTAAAEGYLPLHAWSEFDPIASIPGFLHPAKVGGGAYWRVWPFSFEEYRTDTEPTITPLPKGMRMPVRIIMWQRFFRGDVPQGWRTFSDRPFLKMGMTKLESEEYWKGWSKTLRQNRRDWLALHLGKKYVVEPISFDEFKKTYLHSTLPFMIRRSMIQEVEARMNGKAPLTFWGARPVSPGVSQGGRIGNKKLVGGMAVMDSPSRPESHYFAGCYTKQAGDDPVMVGLLDHWFSDSLGKGITFLDFGNFWKQGDPSAWKGFSSFKAKFNPTYFFYQPKLYQFRFWSKK